MHALLVPLLLFLAPAQHQHASDMSARGGIAMGFDQSRAVHHFVTTADGGEIRITARAPDDQKTIAEIRSHVREIEKLFASGDFTKPEYIHGEMPPGAETMASSRRVIAYRSRETPAGATLVISTRDARAAAAVHEYLRYQIKEHGTGDPLR